jgi:WD40 repeat protein
MKLTKKLIYAFICFYFSSLTAFCDLNIDILDVEQYEKISSANFPKLKSKIRVTEDGQGIDIGENELMIMEFGLDAVFPNSVISKGNGIHEVSWTPRQIFWDSTRYNIEFIVSHNGRCANDTTSNELENSITCKIYDSRYSEMRELVWKNIPLNQTEPVTGQVFFDFMHFITQRAEFVDVDSITISGKGADFFEISGYGSLSTDEKFKEPPCKLRPNTTFYLNIDFLPKDNDVARALLTIHYEGGATKRLPLYGNTRIFPKKQVLTLVKPKGGEIVAPCEEIEIAWKNHSPQIPVEIKYSFDKGRSWNTIATVSEDSVYYWNIPDFGNPEISICVNQEAIENKIYKMQILSGGIVSVGFNPMSNFASALSERGQIGYYHLNLESASAPEKVSELQINDSEFSRAVDISFLDSMRTLIVYSSDSKTKCLTSNITEATLSNPTNIAEYSSKKSILSNDRQYFAILPDKYSPKIDIFDTETLSVYKTLNFDAAVMDFVFNEETPFAYALTMKGIVYKISVEATFTIVDSFDIQEEKLPRIISISANDKLLSFGFINGGGATDNYIYDIEKQSVVMPVRSGGSNPVKHDFSPNCMHFVFGTEYSRQISLVDLNQPDSVVVLDGHYEAALTDIAFAPNSKAILSASDNFNNNLTYRIFSFPDTDTIPSPVFIKPAETEINDIDFGDLFVGREYRFTVHEIKNVGMSIAILENFKLADGKNFKLKLPDKSFIDTLSPTEHVTIETSFKGVEFGEYIDTLSFEICGSQYYLELKCNVVPRNIQYNDTLDFGEVCVQDTVRSNNLTITNKDTIELRITKFEIGGRDAGSFSIDMKTDSLVQPLSSINPLIAFHPQYAGEHTAQILITHSDMYYPSDTVEIKGFAAGADIRFLFENLLFVESVPVRQIFLYNKGNTDGTVTEFFADPPGAYELLTPLPISVKQNDSILVDIQCNDLPAHPAELHFYSMPCNVISTLRVKQLEQDVLFSIPDISVAPTCSCKIPVIYTLKSCNGSYNEKRECEASVSLNSRLFIPVSIVSENGSGEILNSNVIEGRRVINFKLYADFDKSDTVAYIKGYPGTADTDTTSVEIAIDESFSGSGIEIRNGFLRIATDRQIYRSSDLPVKSVSPNPSSEKIEINIDFLEAGFTELTITDLNGRILKTLISEKVESPESRIIKCTSAEFGSGDYFLNFSSPNFKQSVRIRVVR